MRKLLMLSVISVLAGAPFIALAKKNPAGGAMPPPVVQVAAIQTQDWHQSISATGSLAALHGVVVRPEIAGQVTEIYFKSGQNVKKDQPLINLDHGVMQAQLAAQQANLVLRQQQFKRAQALIKLHAIAQADFDDAKANLDSAVASTNAAKSNLESATVTAPFSGRLGLRQVSVGDYVNVGQNIVNLQSLDPIVVNFSIPEAYLNKVAVGDAIKITSDAFPGKEFSGKIYAFDSTIDPTTRTLAARASIPNPDQKLLPGGFVIVTLTMDSQKPVLIVPQTALISALDGSYVYKIVNGKAVKTKVTIVNRDTNNAYISQGLQPNDKIVTVGAMKIQEDNSPVIIASNK